MKRMRQISKERRESDYYKEEPNRVNEKNE